MILLVDDEPALARLYGAAMQQRGFNVMLCSDGWEALERLQTRRCHLVLSDVEMPGMSGYELAGRLTQRMERPCPILFLTGHDHVQGLRLGLEAGADDVLGKGGDFDAILRRIEFWLASGFRQLPELARAGALARLAEMPGEAPILDDLEIDQARLDAAFSDIYRKLQTTPPGFGNRLIERIELLGAASAALLSGCDSPKAFLRFPDSLLRLFRRLDLPWVPDLPALLAHFDDLARHERFLAAGHDGLTRKLATA